MQKVLSIYGHSLGPIVLVAIMLAGARLLGAQKPTSAVLQDQATKLKQDIAQINKSIASLNSAGVPSSDLSGIHTRLQKDEDELADLQKKIREAEAYEKHLNELKGEEAAARTKLRNLSGTASGKQSAATAAQTNVSAGGTTPAGGESGTPAPNPSKPARPQQSDAGTSHAPVSQAPLTVSADHDNESGGAISTGTTGLYTLGIGGVDITSTTVSGPQQQFFAGFSLTAPISLPGTSCNRKVDPLEDRCWVWFDPRIASMPTPKSITTLSSLTTSGAALPALGNVTLGDITQTLEFRGGLEFPIITPRNGVTFGNNPKARLSLSLVAGFGAVTPFNSETGAQELDLASSTASCSSTANSGLTCGNVTNAWNQLKNSTSLQGQYPNLYQTLKNDCAASSASASLTNCPHLHVAFVLPNRSRFYRSYFGGFRLRTFFFKDRDSSHRCTVPMPTLDNNTPEDKDTKRFEEKKRTEEDEKNCVPEDIFPGTFDVTLGRDETVTGGRFKGIVMTLGANYPFPGLPWLRIFGDAHLRLAQNESFQPIALPATQSPVALTDPSVIVQNVQPKDEDYFRIGFGVDLSKLFGQIIKTNKPAEPLLTPPDTLDFGEVVAGESNSRSVTIRNGGSGPLTISDAHLSGSDAGEFSITDNCQNKELGSGQACSVTVIFKPPQDAKAGTSPAALLQFNDNSAARTHHIQLKGTVGSK